MVRPTSWPSQKTRQAPASRRILLHSTRDPRGSRLGPASWPRISARDPEVSAVRAPHGSLRKARDATSIVFMVPKSPTVDSPTRRYPYHLKACRSHTRPFLLIAVTMLCSDLDHRIGGLIVACLPSKRPRI